MKVQLSESEVYPVYSVAPANDAASGWRVHEVPEETYCRWVNAADEFRRTQREMGERYNKAEEEFFTARGCYACRVKGAT